jgi:hypothetical protein
MLQHFEVPSVLGAVRRWPQAFGGHCHCSVAGSSVTCPIIEVASFLSAAFSTALAAVVRGCPTRPAANPSTQVHAWQRAP